MSEPAQSLLPETLLVETPEGPARWLLHQAEQPRWWLLLGHGASGGSGSADLMALATGLPARGVSVARFEQPFVVAGKKMGPRPPVLDRAWIPAVEAISSTIGDRGLALGGRSAGARVACRTGAQLAAAAVVNLAFPLHLPGKPENSRLAELLGSSVPTLTFQGERDPFGGTDELLTALDGAPGHEVVRMPSATHDLKVPARVMTAGQWREFLVDTVDTFLTAQS